MKICVDTNCPMEAEPGSNYCYAHQLQHGIYEAYNKKRSAFDEAIAKAVIWAFNKLTYDEKKQFLRR